MKSIMENTPTTGSLVLFKLIEELNKAKATADIELPVCYDLALSATIEYENILFADVTCSNGVTVRVSNDPTQDVIKLAIGDKPPALYYGIQHDVLTCERRTEILLKNLKQSIAGLIFGDPYSGIPTIFLNKNPLSITL